MLNPHFGVTWHGQFSQRILHHHTTFLAESIVHDLAAAGLDLFPSVAFSAKLQFTKWEQLTHKAFPLSFPICRHFCCSPGRVEADVKRQFTKRSRYGMKRLSSRYGAAAGTTLRLMGNAYIKRVGRSQCNTQRVYHTARHEHRWISSAQ